jgi:hypothetical protein
MHGEIRFNSIQFNSIQFDSIQFNSGIYSILDWNTNDLDDRTNNISEGRNTQLKRDFKVHPGVFDFLTQLQTTVRLVMADHAFDIANNIAPPASRSTINPLLEECLPLYLNDEIDVLQFLIAMS